MNKHQYLKVLTFIIVPEVISYFSVYCSRINDSNENEDSTLDLQKLFKIIARAKESRLPYGVYQRRSDTNRLNRILSHAEIVSQWLRQESAVNVNKEKPVRDDLSSLVEKELLNALAKKTSALLDKPFLQKSGRNDFLVMRPDTNDPFVTIIPNDIYYNVEKKCVNWLTDCNQKGIRNRLLQKLVKFLGMNARCHVAPHVVMRSLPVSFTLGQSYEFTEQQKTVFALH